MMNDGKGASYAQAHGYAWPSLSSLDSSSEGRLGQARKHGPTRGSAVPSFIIHHSSLIIQKCLVVALLAACPALARAGEPSTQMKPISFGNLSGDLGLFYRTREDTRSTGTEKTKTREQIIQEQLGLGLQGSIIHPYFLQFNMDALLGLSQERYTQNNESSSGSGEVLEYSFAADILKEKALPAHIYAGRSDRFVPRQFAPSLRSQRDTYGGLLRWISDDTPMVFSFDRIKTSDQEKAFGGEISHGDTWTAAWSGTFDLDHFGEVMLDYVHSQIRDDLSRTYTDSDEVRLRHDIFFDPDQRYRLVSNLRYLDERGTPYAREFDADTLFDVRHLDNFSTNYAFSYLQRERFGISQEYWDARAGFRHDLYESLTTTGSVHKGQDAYSSGLSSDRTGGTLRFDYRKTDALGTLFLGISGTYENTAGRGVTTTLFVVNEPHQLSAGTPALLINSNVDLSSIVVTDSAGTAFYVAGTDYSVTQVGSLTELRRILGGRIDENQDVLVDYTYRQPGARSEDEFTRIYYARHAFLFGFTPYVRYMQRDDSISPKSPDLIEDDARILTIGAEQTLGRLMLTGEWEDAQEEKAPYRATRLGASYFLARGGNTRDTVAADYTQHRYLPPFERTTDTYSLRNVLDYQLTKTLLWQYTFEYRLENDSVNKKTRSLVNRIGLDWAFRSVQAGIDVEHALIDSNRSDNESFLFMLNVRREF